MSAGQIIEGPLGEFLLPVSTHPRTLEVCRELTRAVFEGEYDHPELPTDVRSVIDIGGGWGAFSAWALAKWPKAVVTGYEPNSKCDPYYLANLAQMIASSRASYIRAAVTVNPNPKINGCEDWGAYHVAPDDDTCAWPVVGVRPNDLLACDVLKLDCEGCEVEVLSRYPFLELCSAVLCEYHGHDRRELVFELLEGSGFRCVKDPGKEVAYGATVWVKRIRL